MRESVISGILVGLGVLGTTLSALAIPRAGIGWDAGIDLFAAQNVRDIDDSSSLSQAYEQVFSTSEFYGVLVQRTSEFAYALFGGDSSLATDVAVSYQLQAVVSLTMSFASAVIAGIVVFRLFSSRVAGAFVFATISTLPYLSGMAIINFKDAPIAAGMTMVSAGAAALWRSRDWRWLIAATGLVATGTFFALGVRIGAWTLIGGVLLINAIAMTLWRIRSTRPVPLIAPTLASVLGVGVGLTGLWLINPIARIDLPRWAWDAYLVSRSYPWIGDVRTMGRDLPSTDLPWWYLPAWLFAQMPLLFLGFALFGVVVWIWLLVREISNSRSMSSDSPQPCAVALTPFAVQALALPAGMVVLGATLYDGIRHITFALPALIVLMAPLIVRITDTRISRERSSTGIAWVMALALIAVPVTSLLASIRWFPYMYAHVNVPTAVLDADRDWEYDYWGTTVVEGAHRLRDLGVDKVVVLPEIDPRGTSEVARISGAEEEPSDETYGLYVFRRYDARIPGIGCEQVVEIKRAGVILGEAAICDGNVEPIP